MNNVSNSVDKAKNDAILGKPNHKVMIYGMLSEVNEPVECVEMLRKLNETISLMYQLSDCGYYLDHIWNAGTTQEDWLKEGGFDEDYFLKVAEDLEKLRAILFGDNLNWTQLYRELYDNLLSHEAYWSAYHEDMWRRSSNRERRLERELAELKNTKEKK